MQVDKSAIYFRLDCLIDFLKSVTKDSVLLKYLEERTGNVGIYSLDNLLIYKNNINDSYAWSETNRLLYVYLMHNLNPMWYAYPKNTFKKLPNSDKFKKDSVISYLSKYEKDIKEYLKIKDNVVLEKGDNFRIYFGTSFLCYLHIEGSIIIKYEDILCSGISHNKGDDYLVIHIKTINESTKLNHKYLLLITGIKESMRNQMIKLLW